MASLLEQQWQILRYVRRSGPSVRAEISENLGFNASVTSALVRQLLDTKALIPRGTQPSGGGRPRECVGINPETAVAIGVHVAMRRIRCALVNAGGEVITERSPEGFAAEMSVADALDAVAEAVNALKENAAGMRLAGVGVAVSGVIRESGRLTREFPGGAHWSEVALTDVIAERCGVGASVVNDVHACALAEHRFGDWGDIRSLILLHLGDGIAAGFVLNGELYRGFTGNAGQIGHNGVTEDGSLCYCGNRGCLESVASPRAMVAACRDAAERGVQTRIIAEAGGIENIAFPHIASAASLGDPFAGNLLDRAGQYIGRAAAGLINTFEPQLLLLSGPMTVQSADFVQTIRAWAKRRSLPALNLTSAVECARLKQSAAALGAAELALDGFFMDRARVTEDLLTPSERS